MEYHRGLKMKIILQYINICDFEWLHDYLKVQKLFQHFLITFPYEKKKKSKKSLMSALKPNIFSDFIRVCGVTIAIIPSSRQQN